jgi:1-deoxy-D-xylulose-5-phosphate synthase
MEFEGEQRWRRLHPNDIEAGALLPKAGVPTRSAEPARAALSAISCPADIRGLGYEELTRLATEIRTFIVNSVSVTGGHLGSNLGVVELTFALHRVFDSPHDVLLWDTGHQAYAHKILTGRRDRFCELRQANGLSGYPSRAESVHDWVENSHASTILSYAHGLSASLHLSGAADRRVVAVIGDGSMTGGMAYEALNNLGHSGRRVLIVLNDNGRSYAPTISRLSTAMTRLRSSPSYVRRRQRVEDLLSHVPLIGDHLQAGLQGVKIALRHAMLNPRRFFEALGVRYIGPVDGHNVAELERVFRQAAQYDGPILVHVITRKGKGYRFAEDDEEKCLHDAPAFDPVTGPPAGWSAPKGYTEVFSQALVAAAERDKRVVAITAAMPGATGLLPFKARFPDRFFDVGIAEQHAVTAAAGMAMGGLRPVVAVYSTFLSRAFDQVNLDVGLHGLPVIFCLDRAGITGDDGPSHHGVLDLALLTKVPGMTVFAPSSALELQVMLAEALNLDGPVAIRYPKGAARKVPLEHVGSGLKARRVREGTDVCLVAVGRMLEAAEEAARLLEAEGLDATVWDARVVKPLDPSMIWDAASHPTVVTVEDGLREGGAGAAIADAIAALRPGRPSPPVIVLGTPVAYIPHGKPAEIHSALELDGPGIAFSVVATLKMAAREGSAT